MNYLKSGTLYLLLTTNLMAMEVFHCTHVQLCNLANYLTTSPVQFKMIHGLEGLNPHHNSPSVAVYKTLKKNEGILFAPLEIEPWFKSYENKSARSMRLKLEAKYAHFWLHPNSLCEAEKQLRAHLEKFTIEMKSPDIGFCKSTVKKSRDKKFVVLTHESLQPLLEDMGHEVFVINTHDEHHDLNPKVLKNLVRRIKGEKVISWIVESQFHHPEAIKKMIKSNHKVLEINTIGLEGATPDDILKRVTSFLEAS